ncbi:MAG: response regulator [Methanospirillaceae archaeon]|nr:response regulator [Methanospirillaceae archaeon]
MPPGSKILIVEDEMIISMEIKQKLHSMGYVTVGQAITGESAIQKAGETMPDLVLMDIRLKGDMDGITAGKRIMDLYDIPIIFLTAHSDKATLERAISVSPSGYLLKPFKERELMTNIEMSLHKDRVRKKLHEEVTSQADSGLYKDIASSPVAAIITTGAGTIEYQNPAAGTLSGYSLGELQKIPFSMLFEEISSAESESTAVPHRSLRVIMPDQVALKTKGGTEIPVMLSTGLVLGEKPEEIRLLYLVRDTNLQEPGDKYLGPDIVEHLITFTETLNLPAFVIDKGMMLAGYNEQFADVARNAGISKYMLNRPIFETSHFQVFADMQEIQEMFRSGDNDSRIKKFKRGKDLVFLQFDRIPLKKYREVTHIVTIIRDITNEKKAFADLRQMEDTFKELYDTLEKLNTLYKELKRPFLEMIQIVLKADQKDRSTDERVTHIMQLISDLDVAWVEYAQVRDTLLLAGDLIKKQ